MSQTTPIETRVDQYVKLRDLIKEKDDAHKAAMKPYREALEKLNNLMLAELNNIGGDSIKTGAGTVYKTERKSASLEDGEAFMEYIIQNEAWELIDRKANVTAVEDFAKSNGTLPPGVKFTVMQTVGVRRS